MTQLKIRLLGSFQVGVKEAPVTDFESNKVRALLAFLAVESDRPHSREKLAELLWPERPARRASSNFNQALYNLRKLLEDQQAQPPYLLRSSQTVQFNPESDHWLDVGAFQAALEGSGLQSRPPGDMRAERLQEAVELYRGDFLEGLSFDSSLAFDEWALLVRQRLQRLALAALHRLADHHAGRGEIDRALPYAWRQVELDPLDEPGCRQLMELLAGADRRSQALAQFEHLQALLSEELGVAPEPETLRLRDRIRGEEQISIQREAPRDNLPAFLTPLIGRRQELAELRERILNPDCRLLTVLGPGGSGKSRLALEVARSCRGAFPDGVFFAPLNPIQSTVSILPAVMEALSLPQQAEDDRRAQLTNYLRDRNVLLVLDGFEHLLAGTGLLVDLLHQAPKIKILVTSRTRLNVKGEHLVPLTGMRFPKEAACEKEVLESDAVQLLLTGLRRARLEYQPSNKDLGSLVQICRQVQGMPLGILLAASWGATLSLEEIAGEVSRDLDLLTAEWSDIPARQRSMRATFDHTWELLAGRERAIFQSLAVFQGAFTRRAAWAVSGASPHELRALVDRSLLWSTSPGWYELHELLRQYGREKLAQSAEMEREVCSRHSGHYLQQLRRLGEALKSMQQAAALGSLAREHENYRAAWNWAAGQGAAEHLAPVVEALCLYYEISQRCAEGVSACQTALERLAQDRADVQSNLLQAHLLVWQSYFSRQLGRHVQARRQRAACRALLDRFDGSTIDVRFEEARLGYEWGNAILEDDLEKARQRFLLSLALFQEMEQPWWAVRTALRIVLCDVWTGDYESAQSRVAWCLERLPAGGDPANLAEALERKAFLEVRQGNTEQAMQTIQDSAAVYRSIGDRFNTTESMSQVGLMLAWHGRYAEAAELFIQCLSIYQRGGNQFHAAFHHSVTGIVFVMMGSYTEAQEWAKKSLSKGRESNFRRIAACSLLVLGWAALGMGDFCGAEEFLRESVEAYRQVQLQDELGWCLAALGQAKVENGDARAGLADIRECLQIGVESGAALSICHALAPWALWIARQGDPIRAVELYNLARMHPAVGNSKWFEDVYGRPITASAKGLPGDVVRAAKARGREQNLRQTAAGLLEELAQAV